MRARRLGLSVPSTGLRGERVGDGFRSLGKTFGGSSSCSSVRAVSGRRRIDRVRDSNSLCSGSRVERVSDLGRTSEVQRGRLRRRVGKFPAVSRSDRARAEGTPRGSGVRRRVRLFGVRVTCVSSLRGPHPEAPRGGRSRGPGRGTVRIMGTGGPTRMCFGAMKGRRGASLVATVLSRALGMASNDQMHVQLLSSVVVGSTLLAGNACLCKGMSNFGTREMRVGVSSVVISNERVGMSLSMCSGSKRRNFFIPSSTFESLDGSIKTRVKDRAVRVGDRSRKMRRFTLNTLRSTCHDAARTLSGGVGGGGTGLGCGARIFLMGGGSGRRWCRGSFCYVVRGNFYCCEGYARRPC